MTQNAVKERSVYEGLVTALAVGGFFIIIGFMFVLTPNLWNDASAFFQSFTTISYTVGSSTVNLPAPANPAANLELFTTFMYFIVGIGILQIIILPVRLAIHSPIRRIAETVGNLVFWLGAAVMANVFLLAGTITGWFQFWASLIILVGVSMIARFGVYFAARSSSKQTDPKCC